MDRFYLVTGIEIIFILLVAIIINQFLHRYLAKKGLNFITPILNIFIVIWLYITYRKGINKISSIPNIQLPIDGATLQNYAKILAAILIFIFLIQLVMCFFRKKEQTAMVVDDDELPKFKPGADLSNLNAKEYPLPNIPPIKIRKEDNIDS